MSLAIVCSGCLLRCPLGGFSWHHLQYLVGLRRLGHRVVYFEDFGWSNSCFDARRKEMTSDAAFGVAYLSELLRHHHLDIAWCYLAEDGTTHGPMSRADLADACQSADLYLNLSNVNWIPELDLCRRRVLIDTDPVFTQIGAQGLLGMFDRHHVLFTYAERVGRLDCMMPTAGRDWLPTRQPVVLDLWPVVSADPSAPFTTVMSWSAYGAREHEGRTFGQKDVQFEPMLDLPRITRSRFELAVGGSDDVRRRLVDHGWAVRDSLDVTADPWRYQRYLQASKGEFSVAKHAYVVTRTGWFSDRTCGYLASGRPVVVEDTGFSDFLPCGQGLLTFNTRDEAAAALRRVEADYDAHCCAARVITEQHFDANHVLGDLLARALV